MAKSFTFICGDDEFLVDHKGKELYDTWCADSAESINPEIIEGQTQSIQEVEKTIQRFMEAVQVLPLWGGLKVVWLRGVSFLGELSAARSESVKEKIGNLQAFLESSSTGGVRILITAYPVDRRTREYKWFMEKGESHYWESTPAAVVDFVQAQSRLWGVQVQSEVAEALLQKLQGNLRAIFNELQKLMTYVDPDEPVTLQHVYALVPESGEGDFFEFTEAFYTQNISVALAALDRYFFIHKEPRPLLASLQNRNRLILQLKAMIIGPKAILKTLSAKSLSQLAETYPFFPSDLDKTSFSVFTQNPWYLGRLLKTTDLFSLRQLIDYQLAFTQIFEKILEKPASAKKFFTALVMQHLSH